jgi:RHS repeat-associated protein
VDYYKAEVLRQNDYYPFGMQMPGRTFTVGSSYRYGFNGKENDNEVKNKEGSQQDYGMRIYDTRLGRWLSVDPLAAKYPFASPYNYALNTPIQAIDPDGKDVIYVNGYRFGGTGSASNRDDNFQKKLKDTYWNKPNREFTNTVEKYFNDHTEHFVTGDHWAGSTADDRIREGKEVGIKMVSSGEIKVSKVNNIMTVVMHSQGNAEGVGIAMGIIEQAKMQGVDITVNLVFLSVHQPNGISKGMSNDLKKRGIQFTYANDDAWYLQPQAKQKESDIKGVVDAKVKTKIGKKVESQLILQLLMILVHLRQLKRRTKRKEYSWLNLIN